MIKSGAPDGREKNSPPPASTDILWPPRPGFPPMRLKTSLILLTTASGLGKDVAALSRYIIKSPFGYLNYSMITRSFLEGYIFLADSIRRGRLWENYFTAPRTTFCC